MKSLLPGRRDADSAFVPLWAGLVVALAVLALGEVLDTTLKAPWYWVIFVGGMAALAVSSVIKLRFHRQGVTRRARVRSTILAALFFALALTAVTLMFVWWHKSQTTIPPAAVGLGAICFVALVASAVSLYRSGSRADR